MADPRLIPPSINDARTRAVADLLDRLDALPTDIISNLYDPDLCNEDALPLLAHEFGVLDAAWVLADTIPAKRALVKKAIQLQKARGTPWALQQALAAVGWPGLTIQERSSHWAKFKLTQPLLGRSVLQADLDRLLPTIDAWKPARCVLEAIEFLVDFESSVAGVGHRYDGTFEHDGTIIYDGLAVGAIAYAKVGHGTPTVTISAVGVVDHGDSLTITFTVDTSTANGLTLDTFAVYRSDDALIAEATTPVAPTIVKTSAISLAVTWTLLKL